MPAEKIGTRSNHMHTNAGIVVRGDTAYRCIESGSQDSRHANIRQLGICTILSQQNVL